jgi:hypothetical protein
VGAYVARQATDSNAPARFTSRVMWCFLRLLCRVARRKRRAAKECVANAGDSQRESARESRIRFIADLAMVTECRDGGWDARKSLCPQTNGRVSQAGRPGERRKEDARLNTRDAHGLDAILLTTWHRDNTTSPVRPRSGSVAANARLPRGAAHAQGDLS